MTHARSPWIRRLAGLGITMAAAGLAMATAAALPAAAQGHILNTASPHAIPGSYLVVYKDGLIGQSLSSTTATLAERHNAKVTHQWSTTVRGFAADMSEADARKLAADPNVAFVEVDQRVTVAATQSPTPSWGLDRIDQRNLPLDNSYTYPDGGGQGITAFVIDTGILISHQDFGGRATWGTNTTGDGQNTDCQGHGTHVASTTAGTAYGVAKRASLVAVKVLNCQGSGSNAGVISGVEYVTNNSPGPAVANMSLGGGAAQALDNAVTASINSGVTYAVAAGNGDIFGNPQNACNYSPARTPSAITVGATQSNDAKASFSNFGTCLDIFAPGVSITAAWIGSNTATNTISGTSMASPHVAGAAALQLATNTSQTPAQVTAAIINNATTGVVTNPGTGSPNRLLYVGGGSQPPGAPTVANPGTRTSTVGTAASQQMTASGGTTPYTWSASGLPAGLSINSSSGLISGTPTTAGTSNVTVTATGGGVPGSTSFQWVVNPVGGGCNPQTNGTDVNIPDTGAYAYSNITFSGCSGNASASTSVSVNIVHTFRGDLQIHLIAPDGSAYLLKNSSYFDSADNVIATYTVNASSEAKNGQWRLRVRDVYAGDTGYINSFGLSL